MQHHKLNPKISVIIPTYNRANLVAQTIKSVINQSFTNYEIIVIDDGSTDNTQDALESFRNIPNFKYFRQENLGRSLARNAGMARASGEYLIFLDSDDLLEPKALEYLYDVAHKFPESGVVAGRRQFIDEAGEILEIGEPMPVEREIYAEKLYLEPIEGLFFPPSTYIIKKTLAEQINGFDSSTEPSEDTDFFIKYCNVAHISFINKLVVNMRRHGGNTSEVSLRKTSLKISQKNFDLLISEKYDYEPKILQRMKAAWQIRIGNDFYWFEQNKDALKHYLRAVLIRPRLITDKFLMKQIIAVFTPKNVKEKTKAWSRKI